MTRALIARALDKAAHVGVRGGIAVVGASGVLVSASRMDRGGAGGMARARSKAWISATQQISSTEHHVRMATLPPPIAAGFVACSPEANLPGAGGMPIFDDDGVVVGGVSASGATVGPFVNIPGIDRRTIQQDTMDETPTAAPFVAQAVAAGAATFGVPSDDVEPRVTSVLPFAVATVPGGLPVRDGDRVVAGLGIAGPPPAVCHEIAAAGLA